MHFYPQFEVSLTYGLAVITVTVHYLLFKLGAHVQDVKHYNHDVCYEDIPFTMNDVLKPLEHLEQHILHEMTF